MSSRCNIRYLDAELANENDDATTLTTSMEAAGYNLKILVHRWNGTKIVVVSQDNRVSRHDHDLVAPTGVSFLVGCVSNLKLTKVPTRQQHAMCGCSVLLGRHRLPIVAGPPRL